MKVLVIPDCHLKPDMFRRAEELLADGVADRAVYLGDTPDDYGHQDHIYLYEDTFGALLSLVKHYPDTLLCYGNHDISYLINGQETGYSIMARESVVECLGYINDNTDNLKYIHRIDDVIFCHGGVTRSFVCRFIQPDANDFNNIDKVIDTINNLPPDCFWIANSPIWFRPQRSGDVKLYKEAELLQVVGHTPMKEVTRKGNVLSCDVFSTHRDGSPIGTDEFVILDTKTWNYSLVK